MTRVLYLLWAMPLIILLCLAVGALFTAYMVGAGVRTIWVNYERDE